MDLGDMYGRDPNEEINYHVLWLHFLIVSSGLPSPFGVTYLYSLHSELCAAVTANCQLLVPMQCQY